MRYLIAVLLLAGCATPEQRADRAIAHFGPYCDRLGFEPASDGWRNCITQQQTVHAQRSAATAANVANIQRVMQPK